MGHWNYRAVARYATDKPYYTIRECFYNECDDRIPRSWSERDSIPFGDSLDELKEDLNMMLLAFNKPVLVEEFDGEGNAVRLVEE